jgi:hypothetical protein
MKHICETMRDYIDAMNTSLQGDTIFCSEELWKQIMKHESQPNRLNPEDAKITKELPDSLNWCNSTSVSDSRICENK